MMKLATFIGEIARPFAIIWVSFCSGVGVLILATKMNDPVQAGVFMGVVFAAGLTPIYLGKAIEESVKAVKGK